MSDQSPIITESQDTEPDQSGHVPPEDPQPTNGNGQKRRRRRNNGNNSQNNSPEEQSPTESPPQEIEQSTAPEPVIEQSIDQSQDDTSTLQPINTEQPSASPLITKLRTPKRLPKIDLSGQHASVDIPPSIVSQNGNGSIPPAAVGSDFNQPSQLTADVLVQQDKNFRSAKREEMQKRLEQQRKRAAQDKVGEEVQFGGLVVRGTMTPGLYFQSFFHTLALILQGALAGFTLAECASIWMFTFDDIQDERNNVLFVQTVGKYALPIHTAHYVLILIVSIAVMDRYDIGSSFFRVFMRAIRFQSGGLAIVVNMIALVLSLCTIGVENKIELFTYNQTEYLVLDPQDVKQGYPSDPEQILPIKPILQSNLWFLRYMYLSRAIALCIAWIIIALRPQTDCLHKHMKQTIDTLVKDNVVEVVTVGNDNGENGDDGHVQQ